MLSRQRAFTLIELLVVIVIIGSMLSLAVFSTGNGGGARELRSEAERLSAVIALQLEEATLDSREYGLQLRRDSYQVLAYDERSGGWTALSSSRAHQLPAWMQLDLQIDGSALQLPTLTNTEEPEAISTLQPQLLLLSSGELSPFRLHLRDSRPNGQTYAMSSDGFSLPQAHQAQAGK